MQEIRSAILSNPGKWITLIIKRQVWVSDPTFLKQLMHNIVDLVHELKSDICHLILEGTQLTELPEHIFDSLTQLRSLNLSGNKLTTLPEHIFDGLSQLKEVDLSYNQLTTIHDEHIFDGLSQLKWLNLSWTGLDTLPKKIFAHNTRLQTATWGQQPERVA